MSSADAEARGGGEEAPRTRRDLLRTGAAAAAASLLGVLGLTTAGQAKNGDAVRAGQRTTATRTTTLESRTGPGLLVRNAGGADAIGVRGSSSSKKGIGVLGEATAKSGETAGIQGTSASSDGAAGLFVATGGGTAVDARAAQKNGVALRTKGRLELTERSGISPVSGGAEFVIPVAGGLGNSTIVLATLQDHQPGVHVESATVLDADQGLIVVRLNQALAEPARVGWLVLG